ncbi:MAG TPA: response regulator transcription factor [Opitutaceae bacterium]|nr:response regulator transcription factor [Opitutaceae bacterium]
MVKFTNYNRASVDAPQPRRRRLGSKTRVYVADDQVVLRRGVASTINAEPDMKICGESADLATATNDVRELRPDVVIVELTFSGERGGELIENIRTFDSGISIVVLSLLDETLHALPALKSGASAFVTKQAPPSTMLEAIRKVRDGLMCVSERISGVMMQRAASAQGLKAFSPASSLSPREREVFRLIGTGHSNREIAERLRISYKTVETHRAHIKEKAGLKSGFELLQFSMRWFGEDVLPPV